MTYTQLSQCPANVYDEKTRRCAIDSKTCMHSEKDGRLNPNTPRCLLAKGLLSIKKTLSLPTLKSVGLFSGFLDDPRFKFNFKSMDITGEIRKEA